MRGEGGGRDGSAGGGEGGGGGEGVVTMMIMMMAGGMTYDSYKSKKPQPVRLLQSGGVAGKNIKCTSFWGFYLGPLRLYPWVLGSLFQEYMKGNL